MVSVIVNTKDEEKNIAECLLSIRNQNYSDVQTIVVDHPQSSDQTRQKAAMLGALVFLAGPERSEQKNFGAAKALGDFLLFIDADMRLSPDVVSACVELAHQGFEAIIIPEVSVGIGFWAKCLALEKEIYLNDPFIEAPRFFKRAVFEKVGGYQPGLIAGEDWDLRNRILKEGGRLGRVATAIYHEEGRLSLIKILSKKFYYARHAPAYLSANPVSFNSFLRFTFRISFLKNVRFIFLDPFHFLGLVFLKFLEFVVGLVGWLGNYL